MSHLEGGPQIRPRGVERESNADPRCMHLPRRGHGPQCIESVSIRLTSGVTKPTSRPPIIKGHPVARSPATQTNPRCIHSYLV